MATVLAGKLIPLEISTDNGATYKKATCLITSPFTSSKARTSEVTQCGTHTALGEHTWGFSASGLLNSTPLTASELSAQDMLSQHNNDVSPLVRMRYPATSGTTATGTSVLSGTTVASVTVTSGGTGYLAAPTVTFTGGAGTGAAGTANINASGVVTSVTITAPGTGYTSAPTVAFSAAPLAGSILAVSGPTLISEVSIENPVAGNTSWSARFDGNGTLLLTA